jgi:hypothetical protein
MDSQNIELGIMKIKEGSFHGEFSDIMIDRAVRLYLHHLYSRIGNCVVRQEHDFYPKA